jgi:hypothetical protein
MPRKTGEKNDSSDSDSGSDDSSDSCSLREDSEDESSECVTLKGNQTRIPKVHAATTIADCIVNHGNGTIGGTGMFECFHRRGKRYIKHSNRIQSKTLQGQILLSSVTEASETAPRTVRTERARLFYEEHMDSSQPVAIPSESDASEEEEEGEVSRPFVHVGAGKKNYSKLKAKKLTTLYFSARACFRFVSAPYRLASCSRHLPS